jgi:hypothetical protein
MLYFLTQFYWTLTDVAAEYNHENHVKESVEIKEDGISPKVLALGSIVPVLSIISLVALVRFRKRKAVDNTEHEMVLVKPTDPLDQPPTVVFSTLLQKSTHAEFRDSSV